ncbi:MAG: hypothetical protein ACO1N0_14025 [Fluviicola sp.]
MKKSAFLLLNLLLLAFNTEAQEKRPEAKWYLRGKAMTMVVFEDAWYSSISLGTEYRFSKRFSVVLDAVHYSFKNEVEVHEEPNSKKYDEYARRDYRNYLVLEMRYHFIRFKNGNSSIYFAPYSKIGEHKIRKEGLYPLQENERFFLNGNFVDAGLSVGMLINITPNFGIDVSLGVYNRYEWQSYWETDENLNTSYHPQQFYTKFHPNMRLNFYWTFKKHLFPVGESSL